MQRDAAGLLSNQYVRDDRTAPVLCHAKIVPGENCTGRYTLFATKIVPPGTILVAKSVPALPKVYRVVRKYL